MSRVKRGVTARRRRKRILKTAKGYQGARSRLHGVAREAVERAWVYAYRDRKQRKRVHRKHKKRQYRRLWIARINAGARLHGLSYSRMIDGLSKAGVQVDRKILAQLAVDDAAAFGELATLAKGA